jgi:hypothetical protein
MFDAFIIGAWFLFVNALQSFFLPIAKYKLLKKEIDFRLKLIFGTLFMKVLIFLDFWNINIYSYSYIYTHLYFFKKGVDFEKQQQKEKKCMNDQPGRPHRTAWRVSCHSCFLTSKWDPYVILSHFFSPLFPLLLDARSQSRTQPPPPVHLDGCSPPHHLHSSRLPTSPRHPCLVPVPTSSRKHRDSFFRWAIPPPLMVFTALVFIVEWNGASKGHHGAFKPAIISPLSSL